MMSYFLSTGKCLSSLESLILAENLSKKREKIKNHILFFKTSPYFLLAYNELLQS